MKNLRIVLVFSILTMMSFPGSFAQEMSEKETLMLEKRATQTLSAEKHNELNALNKAYKSATPEEQVQIREKIKVLKKEYDTQVKGDPKRAQEKEKANKEDNLEERLAFAKQAKERIVLAKERVKKAETNGEMTEDEAKAKRIKIAEVEEKLKKHELKILETKERLEKN